MWKTPRGASQEPALLPLVKQSEHPCHGCAKCCLYVAIEIDSPTSMTEYDHVLWYLYHENVTVYRDGDGEWSVVFETRCRNLQPDLMCSVYEHRPEICRAFDNRSCEVNDPEGGLSINTPEQFMDYLRERRPRLFKKIEARFVPPARAAAPRTATRG